ncbi:MAG: GNAT family N-acetyltransferase [Prolixibacteraceae bacterium]|nr:GNAT family N-acetyltransferase [Prolixibacteraceae bacterium]
MIEIRRVGEDDIPAMTAARLNYLTEMQGERPQDYLQVLQVKLQQFFIQTMREGSFFALLAEYDGKVVSYGAMVLKKIPGDLNQSSYLEGDILNMYTLPEYRRKGISSLILKQLLTEAKSMGVSKVALHCSKAGEPLYRKFGFKDPVYPYLELIIN